MLFTADFETTTNPLDCRVWAWAVCEVGNTDNFHYGNSIDSFIDFTKNTKNSTYYFHNLKFDGEFLISHILKNGYKHTVSKKERATKTFNTLISDKGQFYSMEIVYDKTEKKSNTAKFIDSYKILPFKVKEIAKAFNLPISKLEIDYNEDRAVGHILTPLEVDYIRNDVTICAMALNVLFSQNLTKMTQGSNALFDYKNTVTEKNFNRWFPSPEYDIDKDMRQTYKGGFTFLNPRYAGKDVGEGLVLDVNSLYPSVMRNRKLPYGEPIFFEGKYEYDELYPLYMQKITCAFELKEGYLPTIQLKHNLAFIPTQYLSSSKIICDGEEVYEEVTMCLTSVDLELFLEHYEVYNLVYHNGWKFKATIGLFTEYIDKWTKIKIESSLNGNKAMRTLAKLMLNALYGKFGLNPNVQSNIPYLEGDTVKYRKGEKETRKPIYIPAASFITAWARYITITSAQKVYDKFIYADTDSLHLDIKLPEALEKMSNKDLENMTTQDLRNYGVDLPEDFEVSPVDLGAWKIESRFTRARFLRQKTYIEDWNPVDTWGNLEINSKDIKEACENLGIDSDQMLKSFKDYYDKSLLNITCAGMPDRCYQYVSWDNFFEGATYKGKLQPKRVSGGVVLQELDFTIKRTSIVLTN